MNLKTAAGNTTGYILVRQEEIKSFLGLYFEYRVLSVTSINKQSVDQIPENEAHDY